MKKTLSAILLAGFILLPGAAFAGKTGLRCYTPAESEAEQGIRIHSELMVIGLNCQHMGKRHGQRLYPMYREFTAKHGKLFAQYESILLNFFKKNGEKNPEASINTLRTNFANKISNDAAGIRPDIFCAKYAPRIMKASEMSAEDLRKWAATVYDSHPVSYPTCASATK
ncbi:MAG: hypothetical protein WBK77_01285 [Alphaproteobacteria bacterium]